MPIGLGNRSNRPSCFISSAHPKALMGIRKKLMALLRNSSRQTKRTSITPHLRFSSHNLNPDRPSQPPQPRKRRNTTVSSAHGTFNCNLVLQSDLGATGSTTSEIPSVPNVDESEPVKLSSHIVDPTTAYENKPNWKSTVHALAGLVIDVLKESSDACTPLKSVAGGLSTILKYYDVWYIYFSKLFTPLTFAPASDGEPWNNRIFNTQC